MIRAGFRRLSQLRVPVLFAGLLVLAGQEARAAANGGIAMYGEPALTAGDPLPYADPAAPRGGRLTLATQGSFDSLNPFIVRGAVPEGVVPLVVQPLMLRSLDEPFTLYGLVAESVETDDARSWVEFRLNPRAAFSDGAPVLAEDVRQSFELLRRKGKPTQRRAFDRVQTVEIKGERAIRFTFKEPDRELPLLLALLPVLARHATDMETFDTVSLSAPLGSGPYVLGEVKAGASLTFRRNPAFWGKDLPILRGVYNFDEVKLDFYRDASALFEAFKAGLYDVRLETDVARWREGYDFPAAREGRVVRDAFSFAAPKPMAGFVFNTREPLFADARLREGLAAALDLEWLNANLFSSAYARTDSYFPGFDLTSTGRPADEAERALLARFPDAVRPDVMEGRWRPPASDGSGRDRSQMAHALSTLASAGWALKDGAMRGPEGEPLVFEILVVNREQERLALAFSDALARLGVGARVRTVDSSQYWGRIRQFSFDVILWTYPNSASPGVEQANRWSSGAASAEGSFNFAGVRSPAVDAMVEALRAATTPEQHVAAVRALDRVLLSGFYVVPLFNLPQKWAAWWTRIARPARMPRYDLTMDVWWARP